jgi:hypothetical protein
MRAVAPSDSDAVPSYCDVATPGTCTNFVAETNLPTTNGLFRVRAYRHWVRALPIGRYTPSVVGDDMSSVVSTWRLPHTDTIRQSRSPSP